MLTILYEPVRKVNESIRKDSAEPRESLPGKGRR